MDNQKNGGKNCEKLLQRHKKADISKTESRNMTETRAINFSQPTAYLTSISVRGSMDTPSVCSKVKQYGLGEFFGRNDQMQFKRLPKMVALEKKPDCWNLVPVLKLIESSA